MAVINKQWSNGDALTLTTSAGGIAVSSAQNLTGADRQMTVQVRTTNAGAKVTKNVTVRQLRQPVDTRGYWIHKDTNVKTYFDATADFIVNGVMQKPSWISNAKEIRLCAGITDFTNQSMSQPPFLSYSPDIFISKVFVVETDDPEVSTNTVLEKLDFGSATASTCYCMFVKFSALKEVILNGSVTKISALAFWECPVLEKLTIPSSVTTIENSQRSFFGSTSTMCTFNDCPNLTTIYTDVGNTTTLSSLLSGKGLPGGYQIIEQ